MSLKNYPNCLKKIKRKKRISRYVYVELHIKCSSFLRWDYGIGTAARQDIYKKATYNIKVYIYYTL